MKKNIVIMLFFLFMPFMVNASEKVKVYIFEAGGCPYCEREVSYLKSLDSYGLKFEIIEKELYVDHVEWKEGKDYELGVNVANAFQSHNFKYADSSGTPFVVISDLYASTNYSTELENYINDAYEKGDKDVVSCIENGGTADECISISLVYVENKSSDNMISNNIYWLISGCTFLIIIIYIIKSTIDYNRIIKKVMN